MSKINLPSYIKNASPNPASNRAPWYKNTAPTYAGIILWFVFWDGIIKTGSAGGGLAHGIMISIAGVVAAALLCHFLFYLVPALLGQKSGHSLAVVGSSVFGAKGGIIMPGLLMGLLQFGWVAVNVYFSSLLLHETLDFIDMRIIMVVWGVLATFMGLKGIKYVAPISTYLPLIPFAVLIVLLVKTAPYACSFTPEMIPAIKAGVPTMSSFAIFGFIVAYVIGFFATAGAAGVDFGTGSRNSGDVQKGGLIGISLAMIFTGVAAVIILAGAYAKPEIAAGLANSSMGVTEAMSAILGVKVAKTCMFLMALAAFPAACFSSLIAANSFKNMLPNVNANLSVSIGGAVAIALAVFGYAANAPAVFGFIGASFGPICGALFVDYFLAGKKWSGPRNGINLAGWISWALGFIVGGSPTIAGWLNMPELAVPMAPLAAFVVGAVVYFICMKANLKSDLIKK